MEYKDFFSPKTLEKLNKKSAENLKTMLGDKNLMQAIMSSQELLSQISKAEAPYKSQLEKLAVDMVKELYPIIDEEGIVLDAKIGDLSSVGSELDEIKVTKPKKFLPGEKVLYREKIAILSKNLNIYSKEVNKKNEYLINDPETGERFYVEEKEIKKYPITESISPESRRRIINAITQGAALRGTFAFYLFKEHLDDLDPTLVEKYNQIMKNSFGIYDDENAIAMMLSALAQGQKTAGGSSKVIINEANSGITIRARAINFPMLVHELIKGLYELISLQGFKGDKASNQAVVDKVDLLKNEPSDIRYGKFIYDAINKIFISSEYDDPRIREFFLTEIYQLEDDEFIEFIENVINEELTSLQQKWVKDTLRDIASDLKADDYDATGLGEIKINNPSTPGNVIYRSIKQMYPQATYDDTFRDGIIHLFPNSNSLNRNSIIINSSGTHEVYLGDDIHGRRFKHINNLLKYIESNPVEQRKDSPYIDEIKINKPGTKKLIIAPLSPDYGHIYLKYNPWFDEDQFNKWADQGGVIPANYYKKFMYVTVSDRNGNDLSEFKDYLQLNGIPSQMVTWHNIPRLKIDSKYYEAKHRNELNETQTNKSSEEKLLESFNEEIKNLTHYFKTPINEYSEKTITTTIERWKNENPKVDDNLAKQLIQRFDQIKSGLSQKLDLVVLSNELKQGQNYLNIDKYSFDDMVKLIKSLPENPDKIKKDAINKFVKQGEIDKPTAQSYVARFLANKDKLRLAAKEGLEDEGFTKEEVLNFIPKKLLPNDSYLDPRVWTWQSFEQMLDALFPSQKKVEGDVENLVSTDADKIYDKNGIEIYKGDDVNKCIEYNPVSAETKRRKYGWCVTQTGNTMYDSYRFGDKSPTFYFVFDRSKDSSPEHSPFNDEWHAFVVQVSSDGKEYIVTGANNRGDVNTKDKGWEGIKDIVPADTWEKIKGLKDYFKPIGLSPVERGRKFASGKNLSLDEFKELSQDEKIQYVQGKASKNSLTPEILTILPQYKISYEGRSTTLANIAIDNRQKFPYASLKDNEALAKRYAIVSSRYYPNDPLPLPFIKYLDEDAKQKYLEKYDDNLTFEYIERFFGDKIAENYVNKQLKNLNYLPKSAIKYIKDSKLKQLFEIYSKLFDSWVFGSETNISDKALEDTTKMPSQTITPIPLNQKQWTEFSSVERKAIIGLIEKFNQNTNYETLLYALPFMIKDGDKKYILLPKSTSGYEYNSWVLVDESGKIVKDNISGDSNLGDQPLYLGYPDESTDYNRIYDIKDLKIK